MDLSTALFLLPLPIFGLLTPAIGQLLRRFDTELVPYWTMAALAVSLGSALAILFQNRSQAVFIYGVLSLDQFSLFFSVIFLFISILVNVTSISYMKQT